MLNSIDFEDEKKQTIEGIAEMPIKMRFAIFDRIWTSIDGVTTYNVYKNDQDIKFKVKLTEEGLEVVLPKKMTGIFYYTREDKKRKFKG